MKISFMRPIALFCALLSLGQDLLYAGEKEAYISTKASTRDCSRHFLFDERYPDDDFELSHVSCLIGQMIFPDLDTYRLEARIKIKDDSKCIHEKSIVFNRASNPYTGIPEASIQCQQTLEFLNRTFSKGTTLYSIDGSCTQGLTGTSTLALTLYDHECIVNPTTLIRGPDPAHLDWLFEVFDGDRGRAQKRWLRQELREDGVRPRQFIRQLEQGLEQ